jgi:hypothetical protein
MERRKDVKSPTVVSLVPMAFAAAKKSAAVFPEVGALMELQEYVDSFKKVDLRLDTYPTIPRPQCSGNLQKNQIAVTRIKYTIKRR